MDAFGQRHRGWQATLFVALLALGFLIAAQLASERPRVRYTSLERAPLVETALALQARQDQLRDRIVELRRQIAELETSGAGSADVIRRLNADLEAARIGAGLIPLSGPGILIRLTDAAGPLPPDESAGDYRVSGRDLLSVVDELWLAGAEAIAVNGERIATTTAFVDIGGTVLVNGAYLAPPYTVTALGPDDLFDRLSRSASWADFVAVRVSSGGIQASFAEPGSVTVPAFVGTVAVRYAEPASPAPTVLP